MDIEVSFSLKDKVSSSFNNKAFLSDTEYSQVFAIILYILKGCICNDN